MPKAAAKQPDLIVLKQADSADCGQRAHEAVSFFITKKQRAELKIRGYDDAAIDKMKPAQAHKILGRV